MLGKHFGYTKFAVIEVVLTNDGSQLYLAVKASNGHSDLLPKFGPAALREIHHIKQLVWHSLAA